MNRFSETYEIQTNTWPQPAMTSHYYSPFLRPLTRARPSSAVRAVKSSTFELHLTLFLAPSYNTWLTNLPALCAPKKVSCSRAHKHTAGGDRERETEREVVVSTKNKTFQRKLKRERRNKSDKDSRVFKDIKKAQLLFSYSWVRKREKEKMRRLRKDRE